MTKKSDLLGINYGTACNRLRKALMFSLADRLDVLGCHRCGKRIETPKELSIEHKLAWERAPDPVKAFSDLDNIAFSRLRCNIQAAAKPNRIYDSPAEKKRAEWRRLHDDPERRAAYSENRKPRRRKAA